jgi:hypothetical protein
MEPHCAFSDLDVEGLQGMPRVTPGKREEDASVLLLERRSKYFRKHFRTFVHVGPYKKIGTLSTYKIIINNEGTYVRSYVRTKVPSTFVHVYTTLCVHVYVYEFSKKKLCGYSFQSIQHISRTVQLHGHRRYKDIIVRKVSECSSKFTVWGKCEALSPIWARFRYST